MIGRLRGEVAHLAEDHVILDVGGVGYVVHCSSRTLGALPTIGDTAVLYTDMLVREDLLQLFGFPSMLEREWHRLLTTVQGVGAKVSLGILGTLGTEGVSQAIALGDAASIKRAPGVGPKLASRVVNELKSKAPGMLSAAAAPASGGTSGTGPRSTPMVAAASNAAADALSALANLGYGPAEAAEAVARAAQDLPDSEAPALIKAALKALAPGA